MVIKKHGLQMFNAVVSVGILVFGATNIGATTHVVNFGGSLGLTYSPSSFSAAVGDTVQWLGDFSMHPLSSTTIPANAPTWHSASGTSFNYRIAVAGDYHYKCDFHTGAGMNGSFTASTVRVPYHAFLNGTGEGSVLHVATDASGQPYAKITLLQSGLVTMKLFDLQGREIASVIKWVAQAGTVTVGFGAKINNGLYCLRLIGNNGGISRLLNVHQ